MTSFATCVIFICIAIHLAILQIVDFEMKRNKVKYHITTFRIFKNGMF